MSLSGVYQSTALYSGVLFHIQETLVLNIVSFTSYPDRIPNKFQNSEYHDRFSPLPIEFIVR